MKAEVKKFNFNNMVSKSPLVSVIIPVYNVEKYIHRCIESVLSQTYKNIEIILIDDGSMDNSAYICDKYALGDDRIRVFHIKNNGQGNARNIGIDMAFGEYVVFVDSDDYVHKSYVENMVILAEETNCDIVQSKIVITDKNLDINHNIESCNYYIVSGKCASNSFDYKVAPVAKLYKRKLLEDIRFGKWIVNEDDAIYYRIAYNSDKICIADAIMYYYFQSNDSVMRNKRLDKPLDYIDIYYERMDFFEEKKDNIGLDKTKNRFCFILLLNFVEYIKNGTNKSDLSRILNIFKKEYKDIIKSKHISIFNKIIFFIFSKFPYLMAKIIILLHLR